MQGEWSLDRYKAKLVAKRYSQQVDIDFLHSFSAVAKLTTIIVLLTLAIEQKWHLLQLDINNVFLNDTLDKEVYMQLPPGYLIHKKNKNMVCKLHKSLYGLRQAYRKSFIVFSSVVLQHAFKRSIVDSSLLNKGSGPSLVTLLVYVDDMILPSPNDVILQETPMILSNHLKLKLIGNLKYFLRLEITKSTKGIHLCQKTYTLQLLKDTSFIGAKPLPIPMGPNQSYYMVKTTIEELWYWYFHYLCLF